MAVFRQGEISDFFFNSTFLCMRFIHHSFQMRSMCNNDVLLQILKMVFSKVQIKPSRKNEFSDKTLERHFLKWRPRVSIDTMEVLEPSDGANECEYRAKTILKWGDNLFQKLK